MNEAVSGKTPAKVRSWLTNGIKFAIAAAILVLLARSGQLDVVRLKTSVREHPGLFGLGILCMLAGGAVSVQRWIFLLGSQGISPGYWPAFKLTYIGFTFSLVIPGSVSGDIVKAYYVARGQGQKKKAEAVATVAIDRLLGMYTMFFMAVLGLAYAFFGVLWSGEIGVWSGPWTRELALFIFVIFTGMTVLFALFLSRRLANAAWFKLLLNRLPFSVLLQRVYQAVNLYGADRRNAALAALCSIGAQIPLFVGVYCMAAALRVDGISAGNYLVILPVCFTLNSIPVAPGGIGVGEAAFKWVFSLFGSDQGANVALLFHGAFVMLALLGVWFYLRERMPSVSRLQEEAADETSG